MTNKKGVSLVALVITMIVIIILAGIALTSGIGGYDKALEAKDKEERNQVMNAINNRFGDYQRNKTLNPIVGEVVPDYSEESGETRINDVKEYLVQLFLSEGRMTRDIDGISKDIESFVRRNIDNMEYTRILRHNNVIEIGINSISKDRVFLVNYYSVDVVGPI
jgi:type II secretory pathway pseudopilin PulG